MWYLSDDPCGGTGGSLYLCGCVFTADCLVFTFEMTCLGINNESSLREALSNILNWSSISLHKAILPVGVSCPILSNESGCPMKAGSTCMM